LADAAIGAIAVQQLAVQVRGMNGAVNIIQEASLFLEDYQDFLDRARRVSDEHALPRAVDAPRSSKGSVKLDDVWFTYPGADSPALRGVSVTIEPGDVVALVGANGSGKTTVAKLVCGLYTPQDGHVTWDGIGFGGKSARVGVIFQDFIRYQLTAHDNIALGDVARFDDRDGVVNAARTANADEFISSLDAGYDTWLSPAFEGGTDLSVGQWQRVALARALFRAAPLLVLDEPTASLDPAAERELIDATGEMFQDRAVLVISHRFANVVNADHIYVMDDGRVAENGSHEELMELDGKYAEMYRLQASTFSVDRDG
jgi:ATP-binding cassette subfamily B protein